MAETVRINGFVSKQAARALDDLGKKLFPGMPRTDGLVLNKALLELAARESQAGSGDWSDGEAEAKEEVAQ